MLIRSFTIHGIVQGVGFRWFVRSRARQAALVGWARNRPDGSVEVVAGGEPPALQTLRDALWAGPAGARVDRVEEGEPSTAEALPGTFEIR